MSRPDQPRSAAHRCRLRTTINRRRYGRSVRCLRRAAGHDAGRVSVFLAIALTAVIVIIGLAYDGAGRFRTMQRADNLAAEAARAAGQAILLPQAVQGGAKVIDPEAARAAAQAYLGAAGVTGTVEVIGAGPDDEQAVRVTVDLGYDTAMLGVIGYQRIAVTGSATAVLVTG